ncbi:PQQ-binding-like beta-propeller repeat protein [Natrinema sp. SYSU A 869]|uniref:PQQ-binding-like beta-propeller repeat protein n=1 Tax=Natrinema sp. SYSU A 869 TaxID=2871694 RepID=UPI0031F2DF71
MPSRRSFLATGSTLLTGILAGCSRTILSQSPNGTQWTASVPEPTSLSPPCVTNGWLAVGGYHDGQLENSQLAVFDATNGTRQWDVDLGRITGLTASDGCIYVGEKGGPRGTQAQIYAFDAPSGEQLWTQAMNNLASALTVTNEALYAANGSLAALETSDGTLRWEQSSIAGTNFTVVAAPDDQLAADDTAVYFGDQGGVVALSPSDGTLLWAWQPEDWPSTTVGPLPVDTRVYVGADGIVAALDRTTGQLQWRSSFGMDARVQGFHRTESSLLVAEATTQAPSGTFGTVYELSLRNGTGRYERRFETPVTQTTSTSDTFVIGTDAGQITWVDGLSFFDQPKTTISNETILLGAGDEHVFVQTTNGTLYALSRPS